VDLINPGTSYPCDAPGGSYCRYDAPALRSGAGARHLLLAVALPLFAAGLLGFAWLGFLRDTRFDADDVVKNPKELKPLVHDVGGWEDDDAPAEDAAKDA
jgi:hypothetical protein